MEPNPATLKWHFGFDNPTFLGWTVVTAYLCAAACCGWAAVKARPGAGRSAAAMWRLLSAGLLFLGINKQLNLQTLMIVIGRNVSSAGHWYGARRLVQLVFSAVFAAACLGTLGGFAWRWRPFFKENPQALAGAIVLVLFVVLRAATISHADEWFRVNLHADQWCWVLEICGSFLLALSAFHFTQSERE
jgi:hypothetical protein